jgi:MYXO-CTERM domain-containing protein
MRLIVGPLVLPSLLLAVACADPPTVVRGDTCVKTVRAGVDVPTQRAADILIVIDNSGSMQEEQQNLVANFLNQNPDECPLQDLNDVPEQFKNPAPELYAPGGPLAGCGFIQLVAAFDNDFRVGVITTDDGLCDNRIPFLQGGAFCDANSTLPECTGFCQQNPSAPECGTDPATRNLWGYRPQRGCLQPDGPPGSLRKVIARADLEDDDDTNNDLAARFKGTLDNIRTFGSPFERGLDAMKDFLDPESSRGPGCDGDLELFRRPDADLVVIFLTDEEDCSHGLGDAAFTDENAGEICGANNDIVTQFDASECYTKKDTLSPVELYKDVLVATDPRAKVAVIAGGIADDDGVIQPAGCLVGNDGAPVGGCFESKGLSNFSGPGQEQPCGPDTADARGGLPCCVADPGSRYYQFADLVAAHAEDSICNSSFRGSMLALAAFIAASNVIQLSEPPDSPHAILVTLTRAGSDDAEVVPALPAGADCGNDTGFLLEDTDKIVLCGAARPGPGDKVDVFARADANTEEGSGTCKPTNLQASGGGVNCSSTGPAPWAALVALAILARRRKVLP